MKLRASVSAERDKHPMAGGRHCLHSCPLLSCGPGRSLTFSVCQFLKFVELGLALSRTGRESGLPVRSHRPLPPCLIADPCSPGQGRPGPGRGGLAEGPLTGALQPALRGLRVHQLGHLRGGGSLPSLRPWLLWGCWMPGCAGITGWARPFLCQWPALACRGNPGARRGQAWQPSTGLWPGLSLLSPHRWPTGASVSVLTQGVSRAQPQPWDRSPPEAHFLGASSQGLRGTPLAFICALGRPL